MLFVFFFYTGKTNWPLVIDWTPPQRWGLGLKVPTLLFIYFFPFIIFQHSLFPQATSAPPPPPTPTIPRGIPKVSALK